MEWSACAAYICKFITREEEAEEAFFYYSINHARKSIFLTTAYFTPSRRMIEMLSEAVKRGPIVRLLLPLKSDVLAADYAGRGVIHRIAESRCADLQL